MTNTYTIANLHFDTKFMQDKTFMNECVESIYDHVADYGCYTHKYFAETGTWEIYMKGTIPADAIADLQAELSLMPAAFA